MTSLAISNNDLPTGSVELVFVMCIDYKYYLTRVGYIIIYAYITEWKTYLFVSIDSNGWDCHYEWSRNENNALRRCKQNNETDGKCTIYALGDNIVWGDPELYKELTGRD